MKRMKKMLIVFLVLGTSMLTTNCANEEIGNGQLVREDPKITQAKEWFESYKSDSATGKSEEGEFSKAFGNLDYYWENAKVTKLEDSSTGIAVPVKDNPEASDYKGQKMLYLRESDSKYQAILQEIFPESKEKITDEQKKLGFGDLSLFSGYIINWDLKDGFLKGARLKDGLVIADVTAVMTFLDENVATAKMIEMFDDSSNYGSERDDTLQKGGTAAIPLNNVIVTQKSPAPAPRDFTIAGAFGDGGSNGNPNTPTGGGSNGNSDTASVEIAPPSCQSFNFKKTTSLWQVALVKNVSFKIILLSDKGIHFIHSAKFTQAISFGMPTNHLVGGANISQGLAAELSAKALQITIREVVQMYGRVKVSPMVVEQYFKERLIYNYPLITSGGRVNWTASEKLPITDYETTFMLPDNCQ
ncbi:hypothetical protein [Flavobacterium sp. IB48]|uniref:hypothetical protein n=1 Tax=Flavobacterium sp. IB48 TaxID=2779375 RepID=UPI0018E8A0C4|nr:hypothetical protein [Flavobacterium sp. IB48]MBJ2125639.1 hypothetical protein [Flavobacterium sp. IB48]